MGKYYMYFANHMGEFVRCAYADAVTGPWTIYDPGVLHVNDTAFFRAQPDPPETRARGYGQYTQVAESSDGVHFTVRPAITKTSYLRVFERGGKSYGVSRLGVISRASDPMASFKLGPSLFRGTPYAGRVRHVALVLRGDRLFVFFTGIGDAPERVLLSTVMLTGERTTWQASTPVEVLAPQVAARQFRDSFVFEDEGRAFLFYSACGEQGIAAAEITLP